MPHVQTVPLPTPRGSARHDTPSSTRWSVEAIGALYELPFPTLLHRAQTAHAAHFDPAAIQLSSLLSIKTGGCPEDCGYGLAVLGSRQRPDRATADAAG